MDNYPNRRECRRYQCQPGSQCMSWLGLMDNNRRRRLFHQHQHQGY